MELRLKGEFKTKYESSSLSTLVGIKEQDLFDAAQGLEKCLKVSVCVCVWKTVRLLNKEVMSELYRPSLRTHDWSVSPLIKQAI